METSSLQQAIAVYGYAALFLGTLLEGEVCFILGGIAARHGILDPWLTACAALAGGFTGDSLCFFLGRWRGARLLARPWSLARKVVLARALVRRRAVPLMLLSRFLYGLRMVIPMACGLSRVAPRRFLALNFTSALMWVACFGSLGYFCGGWIVAHLGAVQGLQVVAALLVGLLGLGSLLGRRLRRWLNAATPAQAPPEPSL